MNRTIEHFRQDFRRGMRLLGRNPRFTAVTVLTLALGIGATTAIFSVLYATVLAPLPYPDPDRLVLINGVSTGGFAPGQPVDALEHLRRNSRTLASVATLRTGGVNVTLGGPAGAERVFAEQVSVHTFRVLGVEPVLGRWFEEENAVVQGNANPEMIISYGVWQRAFGGDPGVIGRSLPGWTAGWGTTIVGVMPPGFYTRPQAADSGIWGVLENPGPTIGRLRGGASIEEARAEMEVLLGQWDAEPDFERDWAVQLTPLDEVYRAGYARPLAMLLGAVGFVLLIAAVNVANLQLNRGITRESEMAARAALGARRGRLMGQLLVENGVLVLAGGALGVLVALAGIRLFVAVAPTFYLPTEEFVLNGPVLAFALGICLVTGMLSGLLPGLRASKPDLQAVMNRGGRGTPVGARLGVRRVLVVAEVALAMVLLVGAGLMINSYVRFTGVDIGMDPENVLQMDVNFNGIDRYRVRRASNHYTVLPEISNYYTRVIERLSAIPGVESVASTSGFPPRGGMTVPFRVIGGGEETALGGVQAFYNEVSPGFFDTMRVPVFQGRDFTDRDDENAPGVVIISETAARRYFGTESPIGRSILADVAGSNPELENDRVREVVGVVGDVRRGLRSEFGPVLYVPYRQNLDDYPSFAHFWIHALQYFVVRTSGDPASLAPQARQVFLDIDPTVAVEGLMPMRDILSSQASGQAFWMRLLGIFAALGVFLAAIGIYGVVSYAVGQRMREFGIRAAMGASRADVLRLVLKDGVVLTGIGLLLGIGGAWVATRRLESELFGISRMDPATIVAVAAALLLVALAACLAPAFRASRATPMTVLRVE